MVIWELETGNDFTNFVFSSEADKKNFHGLVENYFDESKTIGKNWQHLCMQRSEPMKHADFFEIDGTGTIAISQAASEKVKPLINDKIELLPIETDAGRYYALNVLNFVDCLDKKASKFSATTNGTIVGYTLLEFNEEKIGDNIIFKVPEMPYTTFITDEFQDIYDQGYLQGLMFDPGTNLIWYPE